MYDFFSHDWLDSGSPFLREMEHGAQQGISLRKPVLGLALEREAFPLRNAQSVLFSDFTLSILPLLPQPAALKGEEAGAPALKCVPFDYFLFPLSFKPVAPQIFTGLLFQPFFLGTIPSASQANPDVLNRILPAGQAGVNPAIQGAPKGSFSIPSGPDDDFGVITPTGIQRGMHTNQEDPTTLPNGKFS